MSQFKSSTQLVAYSFFTILGLTLVLYVLRGLGLLTFIPGGVILVLIILSIALGILYWFVKTRR